jgi:ABC-type branched-subunit amino acid transport system substrate-binding protein
MTRNLLALGAAAAVLTCAAVAGASTAATPGVTATRITLGSSGPLTGDAAATAGVLRGAAAYFKYVNGRGGVDGRTIDFRYLDDGDDPLRTVQNVRQLVEQDRVLALFSVVGTSANRAIRDFTASFGVPQLFAAAGSTTLGRDYASYPDAIGYQPPYSEEGQIYARHVLATNSRRVRIAVLYQTDDAGKDLLAGFRKGLGAKRNLILQQLGYDPATQDVSTAIEDLKATGANTLALFVFGKPAGQAVAAARRLGWKPQIYLDATAPAGPEGAVSALWAKDPAAPKFAQDPGLALAAKIAPGALDGSEVAGMAAAFTMVDALEAAGKELTRRSLMTAVVHLNEADNPFLIPGVTVHTTPTSRFPITSLQLQRRHAGHWQPFGGVQTASP